MKRTLLRTGKFVLIFAPLFYFVPELMLFYVLCGIYDVSRNTNLNFALVQRYFFGNGVLTWVLSPFNILMDIFALPYINKGVYKLEDLPKPYQEEIRRLIDAAHKQDLVGQLQKRAEDESRSMFFFKWYGANVDTIVDIPAFHEKYRYIKTIGVSVFNKKQSTSKHFGPFRASLRVLYNINTMEDHSAYIVVGNTKNYWKENKLFIFDDTLLHQSINESDKVRYCLFVDIVRPAALPDLMGFVVSAIRGPLRGVNSIFYQKWRVIRK